MLTTELTGADLDALRTRLTGSLVAPADDGWDAARMPWNVAFDQQPALVAQPVDAADVREVVAFAREHGLRVAPQGTGHNAGPLGPLDGTILLSTSRMRGVTIDPAARTARVEAGVLWVEVTEPASEHGLAPLAGSSPDVGVVGYTLGGGLSWLGRKHGLASESVLAIELVTADGQLRRLTADEGADLFWALRGGGGSFGVVTALEMRLYEASQLYAGSLWWPWERTAEVFGAYREWAATAPEEITTSIRIMQFPPLPFIPEPLRGRSWVTIDGAYLGDAAAGAAALAPLRALGPGLDMFDAVPPAALSRVHGDPEDPTPALSVSTMLRELTPEVTDALVELAGPGSGSPMLMVELRQLGGALARRGPGAGALGTLDGEFVLFAVTIPVSPEVVDAFQAAGRRLLDAVAPVAAGRGYSSFTETTTDAASLFEAGAYARLRAIKAEVDPGDLIRSNHPITS